MQMQIPRQHEKFDLLSANEVSVLHVYNIGVPFFLRVCLGHLNDDIYPSI